MIFIDSNIPMYLVGAEHPNKHRTLALLERLIGTGERLVTSTEVFQEILHRYMSIHRPAAIHPAWSSLMEIVDEVFPVELRDVTQARDWILGKSEISARDAIHAAVMQHREIRHILSFDSGFDAFSWMTRMA